MAARMCATVGMRVRGSIAEQTSLGRSAGYVGTDWQVEVAMSLGTR
jgi:hypothetical protein